MGSDFNIWQGELVRLRSVRGEDWEMFYEFDSDPLYGRNTDHTHFPTSAEWSQKWTTEAAQTKSKNDQFRWIIENLGGESVGAIDTHDCDPRNGTFEYGVAIRRNYWRQGYASDAIRLVLNYFFDELRYQKVNVHIYDFNLTSLKLHRKLGFSEEGRVRRMIF